MKRYIAIFTVALAALTPAANAADIVETAVSNGSFKTLAAALEAAGLVETLQGEGPFTVFAPTDDAFAKLPPGTVDSLLKPQNKEQLIGVLTYHVVAGRVPANKVVTLMGATTVNGQRVDISTEDGAVRIDNAHVVKADVSCSNGMIHVIDAVILPAGDPIPTVAAEAGTFKTLLAAVQAADLADVLSAPGPFTVFAPTDEAFAKLPKGTVESLLKPQNKQKLIDLLKYHVISGRVYSDDALAARKAETLQGGSVAIAAKANGAFVNKSQLLKTDIDASNGVIHVIDAVLLPGKDESHTSFAPLEHRQQLCESQTVRSAQPASLRRN